jgi:hypothetical protein
MEANTVIMPAIALGSRLTASCVCPLPQHHETAERHTASNFEPYGGGGKMPMRRSTFPLFQSGTSKRGEASPVEWDALLRVAKQKASLPTGRFGHDGWFGRFCFRYP